jgi:DNA-binding IclR family transcriptional regulator
MTDLNTNQQEALQDEKRSAIYAFLGEQEKLQSLGEIGRGIDLRDPAKVHYHLHVLVAADLVEKKPGTRKYRLVGAGA